MALVFKFAMAIHSLNSLEMPLLASWRAYSPASYPTSSVGNRPAENALPNLSTTAVVPGSWACEQRGQPNEESDMIANGSCITEDKDTCPPVNSQHRAHAS